MLPIETAMGQMFLGQQFLCDVEYQISEPLQASHNSNIQRIGLNVAEKHYAILLAAYNLVLVLADGQRHRIPRPFLRAKFNSLECYVETY